MVRAAGREAAGCGSRPCGPGHRSEALQKALDVFPLKFGAIALTEALAEFLKDLADARRIDLVRNFDSGSKVRAFGALRASQRVERCVLCPAELRGHLAAELLGHGTGSLTELLERACLVAGCAAEFAAFEGTTGAFHRSACTVELPGRVQAKATKAVLQLAELALEATLAAAEAVGPLPHALALLATLPLPLLALTLLSALALSALALLPALALLSLLPLLALALGAERVVHQALLFADDVAELVHHLHHLLVAALALLTLLARHASRLEAVE